MLFRRYLPKQLPRNIHRTFHILADFLYEAIVETAPHPYPPPPHHNILPTIYKRKTLPKRTIIETMTADTLSKASQDVLLVQKTLANSEEFGRIIEKYEEPLKRYIRRIARPSVDDLDILLQDVFIKIYENLNDFDQTLQFSSWIYRIAHNESIDFVRKKKRTGVSLDEPINDDEGTTLAETIASPTNITEDIDAGYIKKSIELVLDDLEPKYRSVLVLKFLEDKDYEEISDILRKPPGTVATLIHRAKKEFRRIAEEKGMYLGE